MTTLEDLRTLTTEEVAELLGVQPESVRRWTREGKLPAARWGGRLHFSVEPIRQFQAAAAVQLCDPADLVRRARRDKRLRDSADVVRRSMRAGPLRDPADLVRRSRRQKTRPRAAGDVADDVGH